MVYTIFSGKLSPEFKLIASIVTTTAREYPCWRMQAHQSLLFVDSSESSVGIVWDFESGRYTPVAKHGDIGYIEYVSAFDGFAQ